ncbi:hypothetical protein GCM10027176_55250 [Actinoallomurus bryophytorum]
MTTAVLVVTAETVVVVALAVPGAVTMGFALAAMLLLAFTGGLVGVLRRKASTLCHCFGGGSDPVAPRHVVRNVALLTVALVGLAARLGTADGGTASPPGLLLAAGVAVILTLFTVTLDDLAGLFPPAGAKGSQW